MGSANSKRPAASEEMKYLSPTGLYPSCNWDLKTIRKLIIEKKLAPFYPGREEKDSPELDECPICFMFYAGGLNRTKCCHKGVCTECFLQIKKPGAPLAESICPFCNRARFTVIFMGPKSREERMKEEMEEQKVLELQEKIRQEEIERDLERDKQKHKERDQDINNKRDTHERVRTQKAPHTDGPNVAARPKRASGSGPIQARPNDTSSSQGSAAGGPQFLPLSPPGTSPEQDLEDLMLMEAIRLSLIDNSSGNTASMDAHREERSSSPSPEDSGDDRADDYRWAGIDGSLADIDLAAVDHHQQHQHYRPLRSGSSSSSSSSTAAVVVNNRKEKERGDESDKEEPLHPLHPKYNPFAQQVEDVEEGFLVRKRGESAGRSSSSSS
jgi:hypothetical protein